MALCHIRIVRLIKSIMAFRLLDRSSDWNILFRESVSMNNNCLMRVDNEFKELAKRISKEKGISCTKATKYIAKENRIKIDLLQLFKHGKKKRLLTWV